MIEMPTESGGPGGRGMTTHDWAARLGGVRGKWFPGHWSEVPPFAYRRPDGTVATCFGCTAILLIAEGQHHPGGPRGHEQASENRKVSGASADRMFADAPTAPAGATTVGRLREAAGASWVPAAPGEVDCEECNGSGEVECPHCEQDMTCPDCDGTGRVERPEECPDPRYLRIRGQYFDARLFAQVLAVVPDGPVSVAVGERAGLPYLRLRGDGWQVLAIGLYRSAELGVEWSVTDFEMEADQ